MRNIYSLLVAMLFVICLAQTATKAQSITSLNTTANGEGTIIVGGQDEYKVTKIMVVLSENGDAKLIVYADMQFFAAGRWSVAKDSDTGIDIKITGGVTQGDATGTGKLILRPNSKLIAGLSAKGTGTTGAKFALSFVADEKNQIVR